MSEIFYWILNMSITGTILGFLIYFIRYIKIVPRFCVYALWSLVLFRLSIPFSISNKFSLMNLLPEQMVKSVAVPELDRHVYASNYMQAAISYYPITYKNSFWVDFIHIAAIIWLLGAITLLTTVAIMYFLNWNEMKNSTHLKENIYESNKLNVPMVIGLVHPRIILPTNRNPDTLKYILNHEKVHVKRHDNVYRMIAILIACLHWFNPFVWFFLRFFLNDLEIACDAGVLKDMKEEDREQYAMTLLNYNYKEPTLFTSTFGGSKLKERIEKIITYKRISIFSTVCFVILFISITIIFLTNAGN